MLGKKVKCYNEEVIQQQDKQILIMDLPRIKASNYMKQKLLYPKGKEHEIKLKGKMDG